MSLLYPQPIQATLRAWSIMDFGEAPEREVLRDFLKRLLRLAPSLSFESVVDRALDDELAGVARKSVQSFVAGRIAAAQAG